MKGATTDHQQCHSRQCNFNPRTREGCDNKQDVVVTVTLYISIHAPVKGATAVATRLLLPTMKFQSTHP